MEEHEARRYCPQCGEQVRPEASFCEHCGYALDEDEEPETVTEAPRGSIKRRRGFAEVLVQVVTLGMLLACAVLCGSQLLTGSRNTRTATATPRPTAAAATVVRLATETPAPTATSAPGKARDNPVPLDTYYSFVGDRELAVMDLVRPADEAMKQFNPFNPTPSAVQEWAVVVLAYRCDKSANEVCAFHTRRFRLVGRKGAIYEAPILANVPAEVRPIREIFGGGSAVPAYAGFMVDKDDSDLVLIWDLGTGYPAVYFEVNEAP